MADKESEDWYKDVREKQIKRGSASKDDKDLLAIADKLLGGNSQMLVKYNSFPEYEVLKDGKTYRINPETNTAEEIKSNDKLDHEVVNDFSIDAIKDNFTPPGAKGEDEIDPNDKDVENFDENFERVTKDVDKTGMSNEELGKLYEEKKIADEMADFQKSLDDYAAKNKKGREDIPATYKR